MNGRIQRKFKVRCVREDPNRELTVGETYMVVGDDGDRFQIKDRFDRFGMFQRLYFEREPAMHRRVSLPRKPRKQPPQAVPCVVEVSIADMPLFYDTKRKMLEVDDEFHTVFRSKREAKKAIWHNVHSVEFQEGYDPKVAAGEYEIIPLDHDGSPFRGFADARWIILRHFA